ncbi:MAG: SDR family NAD(P)-dependent oxidoreductase, partial [Actinomycetes bacterium]
DTHETSAPLALVAGGSRGLGLLIARELGDRGHRLVVCARDLGELEDARAVLAERGHDVTVEVCDVADPAAVERLVRDTENDRGPIEVLVTVAGVIQVGPLAALSREHFVTALDIMLWGPINTALAVVPAMSRRGTGRIGVITSIGGLVSVPHLLPYSTAKFGAVGFTSGLRAELAGSGVTVTTVAPGLMRTGSHLQAEFVGNQGAEYAWFAPSASLPLLAMDPERAAARIVDGILAGRSWVLLGWIPKVGWRVNALLPRTTSAALGVAARLLPSATGEAPEETQRGWTAREQLSGPGASIVRGLTTLGSRAARRYLQRP